MKVGREESAARRIGRGKGGNRAFTNVEKYAFSAFPDRMCRFK